LLRCALDERNLSNKSTGALWQESTVAVHVCFHNNCFDGAASAALFARFYRDKIKPNAQMRFFGLTHRSGGGMDRALLDAEASAIVDFGFENTSKLTWWFDHHQSAFASPEDRAAFEADAGDKRFFDPKAPSCTGFIAKILQEKFNYEAAFFKETIHWADIIDAARFPDAKTAVELAAPALQLMSVIEGNRDPGFIPRLIEDLSQRVLSAVIDLPYVKAPLAPITERRKKNQEIVSANGVSERGVASFQLLSTGADFFPKFLAYHLYPEARYSVGLVREASKLKISVGYNPWAKEARTHNISEMCARFGGGGHPVVGAVSFPKEQEARALSVFEELVETLKRD
jgi:hypothetical protein